MDCEKYIEYVNNNTESLASYVDTCFEEEKETIKADLIALIKSKITPPPKHYELNDHSGELVEELVEAGVVDLNQTVVDFLQNEYTGDWEWDKKWMTYDDDMSFNTDTWGTTIMYSAICRRIESEFSVSLSDDELEQISDSCDGFDAIRGMSDIVGIFMVPSCIAEEFLGIDQLKLSEL